MKISLMKKFNQIVISTKDVLKQSNETVDQFRDTFLLKLDVFEKERHAQFFASCANSLCEVSTFDALFMILIFIGTISTIIFWSASFKITVMLI